MSLVRLADTDPAPGVKRETGRIGWDLALADFDAERTNRYFLGRYWEALPTLLWIMLNPSVAGVDIDDPTIRKCCGFAQRHGFGGVEVINLFSLISTDPKGLAKLTSFELSLAERYYWETAAKVYHLSGEQYWSNGERSTMVAWGAQKMAAKRTDELLKVFRGNKLLCLGRTQGGQPNHPLMLAYATPISIFHAPVGSPEAVLMAGAPSQP
jgi:hypothetical protein